jgi:low molecular weight protein-tyrosine phosphatase
MVTRVLFVCLGNICRSPTAEGVFNGMVVAAGLNVQADSAGTSGWHNGHAPDARSQAEALARGYDLSAQQSRQITRSDFDRFDLILAMDNSNLADLRAMQPAGSRARVGLLLDYAPDQPLREVPDPYYEHGFGAVFDLIESASRGLIAEISFPSNN